MLLQKPSPTSKSKEHLAKLKDRLAQWKSGKLPDLMRECRRIQTKLQASKRRSSEDTAWIFAKLMFEGKVSAALKFLSIEADSGILDLSDETMRALSEKHPEPSPAREGALLFGPVDKVLPSVFDPIDEQSILKAAQSTHGANGPSLLDAEQYSHILISRKYKGEGKELREQIAILAKTLATTIIDPATIEALTACRLIPLNKNPGVRPIGVGEVLRRIIGKAINSVLKDDVQEAACPLQMATGLKGGAEAAIHSMRQIFEQEETDGIVLVAASNAVTRIHRNVALHNIRITASAFAPPC